MKLLKKRKRWGRIGHKLFWTYTKHKDRKNLKRVMRLDDKYSQPRW
ncbi:hypothetical protein [Ligilactobacillus acidipiscis]|nr:hypothetical protein [Ligilactobacillus acidipiscis]